MELLSFMFHLIGLIDNMNKKRYILLKKKSKETFKNLLKRLDEYNKEEGTDINFHEFFVNILLYSEEDYIHLVSYRKKLQEKAKKRQERQFDPNKPIPYGKGDVENPEYDKYFLIYNDYYKHYLFSAIPKEQKTLKTYFKVTYNYSDEKALEEARKIQYIVFSKKRKNIDNKLIIKELDNEEYRIVGKV